MSEMELAERYAERARQNYEQFGELAPVMAWHCPARTLICMMKGNEDLPSAFGRVMALGAAILQPEFVVTITEVWQRSLVDLDEAAAKAEFDKIRHGDLAKAAEAGDTSVKTALMTLAWTIDPRQTVMIIDTVLDDKTYARRTTVGECDGYMTEMVIGGWRHGLALPAPPVELSDELVASILAMGGDIFSVMF